MPRFPTSPAAAIFAVHDRAIVQLRALVADPEFDWSRELEFPTRHTAGTLAASRKTIFFHALLHSIRHYAQLATLLRLHGFAPDWPMDYLFMGARRP